MEQGVVICLSGNKSGPDTDYSYIRMVEQTGKEREQMRLLIQRVRHASVTVDENVIGSIGHGCLVFVGVADGDTQEIADKMIDKMCKLRIFDDADGKTNLSISDVKGEFLIVSQFTLYANCKKGNRPSFIQAGKPDMANALYEYTIDRIGQMGFPVQHGEFGADMKVELLNDGPFTIILDSEEILRTS